MREIQFCAFHNYDDGNLFDDIKLIDEFETLAGKKLAWTMGYVYFGQPFPLKACQEVYARNTYAHITWETWFPDMGSDAFNIKTETNILDDILNGEHDAYIKQFCRDIADFKHPVIIRMLHEFNGNWYIWSGHQNGGENGGPAKVKAAWKYIVDLARGEDATNIVWMWCPHGPSIDLPEGDWNSIVNYYPGDEYVDWFAIDAYNWFPVDHLGVERPYRDFDNCFLECYNQLLAIADKPIAIAETSVDEIVHTVDGKSINKAIWIEESLQNLIDNYPQIKMLTWFNIKKEKDWRINSSESALKAFRKMIAKAEFTSTPDTLLHHRP